MIHIHTPGPQAPDHAYGVVSCDPRGTLKVVCTAGTLPGALSYAKQRCLLRGWSHIAYRVSGGALAAVWRINYVDGNVLAPQQALEQGPTWCLVLKALNHKPRRRRRPPSDGPRKGA